MSLIFDTIQTDGIAQLSYLLGDDSAGIAAVYTKFAGDLVGGMKAWNNAGYPVEKGREKEKTST